MLKLVTLLAFLSSTLAWGFASDIKVPPLNAALVDAAAILSAEDRAALSQLIASVNSSGKIQFAVLIADSLQDHDIESFSLAVVEAWKLGRKKVDNGLLLIVAPKERKVRFEVGYGLEGEFTDLQSKRIQTQAMTPRFREGDYYGGIKNGILRMATELHLSDAQPELRQREEGPPIPIGLIVLIIFIGVSVLRGFLVYGTVAGASYRRRGWYGGGFGGGGGGGSWGGGGGGFSGGGGGFGGGGSSSSW